MDSAEDEQILYFNIDKYNPVNTLVINDSFPLYERYINYVAQITSQCGIKNENIRESKSNFAKQKKLKDGKPIKPFKKTNTELGRRIWKRKVFTFCLHKYCSMFSLS